jgi:PAS domain S-box-containing protein
LGWLRHTLIEPHALLGDLALRRKSRLLASVLLIFITIFVALDIFRSSTEPGYRPPWIGYLFLAGAYALNRTRFYRAAALLLTAMFPLVIFSTIFANAASGLDNIADFLVLGIFFASIFGTKREVGVLTAVDIFGLLLLPWLRATAAISYTQLVAPLAVNMIGGAMALVFLHHRDQVERDRQAALRTSEENLRIALDAARMGTWFWSVESNRVDWSDQACAIFGVAPGIFGGTREAYLSMVHPDDLPYTEQTIRAAMAGDQPDYYIVHRIVRPDGSVRWIEGTGRIYRDAQGKPTHLAGTVLDVTAREQSAAERARAEAALAASEERYRAISELVSDYAFAYTVAADGTMSLEWVTDAMSRITGYSREEMQDANTWEANTHPDDLSIAKRRRERVNIGQPDMSEYRIFAKDGRVLWLRYYSRPVWDTAAQRVVRVYGAVQDITQIKLLEQQLNHAQRMEAVGRLAGGIAHDFNNLLTVILGNTALLLDEPADSPTIREEAAQVQRAGERAAALTRQLLAFSRQQVLEPRILDLNTVVTDMGQLLQRLIGEDVHFATRLAPDLWPVKADPGQIEQVIMNLAVNARDAMPGGGTLTIETANIERQASDAREWGSLQSGAYIALIIRDSGVGMDAATRARIFEPFFTTKPVGKGTGLGLATVHGIVNQSGGQIELASEPGRGTIFTILLPRTDATEDAAGPDTAPISRPPGAATILLVEDEPMLRALAAQVLRRQGYALLEAEDGAAALRVAAAHAGPLHVLLTDVIMPGGLNGRQLAEQLLWQHPKLKVLYISGHTDTIHDQGSLSAAEAYLQKPFIPEVLIRKIWELLQS